MGDIIDINVDKDGVGWGPFLKIKVWVDITRPLVRGGLIHYLGNPLWIAFKYEQLPNFFFHCCIIKHSILGCSKGTLNSKLNETDQS